jgi:2-polyprenyl-3-methyl-5-hydroxy-6-metoxy-1,4-benzoquinol methylase
MTETLKDELLSAVCEFENKSMEEVNYLMLNNPNRAVQHWKDKKDIIDFYENTDVYIYGLIEFTDESRINDLTYALPKNKQYDILDYGAGIGILDIVLSRDLNKVYYYDLPSKTKDFAQFLAKKYNAPITFLDSEETAFSKQYDIIICTDVLEHLTDTKNTFYKLWTNLKNGGYFLTTGLDFSVGEHTPMHLPENLKVKEEYNKFISENGYLIYYYSTPKEHIYLWRKIK